MVLTDIRQNKINGQADHVEYFKTIWKQMMTYFDDTVEGCTTVCERAPQAGHTVLD